MKDPAQEQHWGEEEPQLTPQRRGLDEVSQEQTEAGKEPRMANRVLGQSWKT